MKLNITLLVVLTATQLMADQNSDIQDLEYELKAVNQGMETIQIEYKKINNQGILKLHSVRQLYNIEPLATTPLLITQLDISNNGILSDLRPLRRLPLTKLQAHGNNIFDLSPLSKMPLKYLSLGSNKKIKNLEKLSPLALEELYIPGTNITDLTPLSKMPLRILWITETKVRDLTAIKNCPIEHIAVSAGETPFFYQMNTDNLKKLSVYGRCKCATDLSWIKGLKIEYIDVSQCRDIKSLSPVMECPNLKLLHIRKTEEDLEFLKQHPTLEKVSWFEDRRRVYYDLEK